MDFSDRVTDRLTGRYMVSLSFRGSVTETVTTETVTTETTEDDQALLDRLAKREERRLRRMKEALERQKEAGPHCRRRQRREPGGAARGAQRAGPRRGGP